MLPKCKQTKNMKLRFFKTVFGHLRNLLPIYDFGTIVQNSDYNRDKTDLIHDIQRKRALTQKLGKKIEFYFALTCFLSLLLTYSSINHYFIHTEKRAANHYIEQFNMRIENMNSPGSLVKNTEIVIALSFIKEGEFEKASRLLLGLKNEDAEWLMTLCYIRLKKDSEAKGALQKIIGSKGHYSVSAQEVLNKYYK
jgi:hypothetical protein